MKAAITVALAEAVAVLALVQAPAQQTQTPASQAGPAASGRGRGPQTPPPPRVTPKAEELARIREKTEQIEKLVAELKAKHADPVLLNDVPLAIRVAEALEQQGFFVGVMRPPSVPNESPRLRITVSAAHEPQMIERLLGALKIVAAAEQAV